MTPKKICEIFLRFQRACPRPTTELIYKTPFELLVAVMLSAQALDSSVNKATHILFPIANTPEAIRKLGETGLKKYIKTIGLYNTKAANIIKMCGILIAKHHSKVPRTREELESLPGVGRKTANVVLNTFFNEKVIPVDTHVFRVAHRIGLAHGKTPLIVEKQLMKVIPSQFLLYAHHWLILHGRYICKARKPLCADCLIQDLCEYPYKNL